MQDVGRMIAQFAGANFIDLIADGHAHAATHYVDRLLFRMLVRPRALASFPVHMHDLNRLAAHYRPSGVGMGRGDQMILIGIEPYPRHALSLRLRLTKLPGRWHMEPKPIRIRP